MQVRGELSSKGEEVDPISGTPEGSIASPYFGYHLARWTLIVDGGEIMVSDQESFVPTKDSDEAWTTRHYIAYFEEDDEVLLEYKSDDENIGEVSPESETVRPASGLAEGSEVTVKPGYHVKE